MDLYISDLDGTLLNNNAILSENTITLLNQLILQKNINFTIATARTPATVCDIMEDVNISIPAILMNGSVIYDIKKKHYISYNHINSDTVNKIIAILNKEQINAFVYTIENDFLNVYHSKPINCYQQIFYDERFNKTSYKKFIQGNIPNNNTVLYFAILNSKEKINNLYKKIKTIPNINFAKYQDNYNKEIFYLEIYDIKSSKANGIKYLKQKYNFERIISFGDNYNDIPMFNISDECYAVSNAVEDLKKISTSIIESNIEDAVPKSIFKKILSKENT